MFEGFLVETNYLIDIKNFDFNGLRKNYKSIVLTHRAKASSQ